MIVKIIVEDLNNIIVHSLHLSILKPHLCSQMSFEKVAFRICLLNEHNFVSNKGLLIYLQAMPDITKRTFITVVIFH